MRPHSRHESTSSSTVENPTNAMVKELRKALRQGGLFAGKFWVAETPKLLDEALRSGLNVPVVYVAASRLQEYSSHFRGRFSGEWTPLGERALESLTTVESSQGLLALVEKPALDEPTFFREQRLTVVLDRIQDPGNAGTILRAAEAFGATGAVFLGGSALPDTPKVLRASAGSRFRLPVVEGMAAGQFLASASTVGMHLYVASPTGECSLRDVKWEYPAALIVGNEGAGVQAELERRAIGFRIPTQGVESLNAGVSASIVLYAIDAPNGGTRKPGGATL